LSDDVLTGSIEAENDWVGIWRVKARQTGPDGRVGSDGESFVGIVEELVNNVESNQTITGLRNNGYSIHFTTNYDIGDLPVPHLRPHNLNTLSYENQWRLLTWAQYSAVEPTVSQSKSIWKWQFGQSEYDISELLLPNWIPDSTCMKPNYEDFKPNRVDFEWWDNDSGIGNIIKQDAVMPHRCCQEDFFFCPNLSPCPPS